MKERERERVRESSTTMIQFINIMLGGFQTTNKVMALSELFVESITHCHGLQQ